MGEQFIGNMGSMLLVEANNSGHDSSTTQFGNFWGAVLDTLIASVQGGNAAAGAVGAALAAGSTETIMQALYGTIDV